MARPRAAGDELDALIRSALERVPGAASAAQVHRALPRAARPTPSEVSERLAALASAGAVHRWPGGRSPLFSARRYEDHLRERIASAVSERPRTESDLRKLAPASAAPLVGRAIADLVEAGRLFRHPARGRRRELGGRPAEPRPYLEPLVERAVREVTKKGFAEPEVRAALLALAHGGGVPHVEARPVAIPVDDAPGLIRRTILELNPAAADSAVVYLPHVRVAVGGRLDKDTFDRTLLAMLSQQQIQLQAHPVPSQLSPEEKDAMVPDGRGSYYMVVGLR